VTDLTSAVYLLVCRLTSEPNYTPMLDERPWKTEQLCQDRRTNYELEQPVDRLHRCRCVRFVETCPVKGVEEHPFPIQRAPPVGETIFSNGVGGRRSDTHNNVHGAPGPVAGGGFVGLLVALAGVYWARRRKKC
jgi:hypothetical protein